MKVKSVIGDIQIKINDFHSDELDGKEYYPKIIPSSTREKLIELANKNNNSELIQICDILVKFFDKRNKIKQQEEYKKYEFCNFIRCRNLISGIKTKCIIKSERFCSFTAKEFHNYLNRHGYKIIKK